MKPLDRVTLMAVAAAYADFLCHQALRPRAADRWCRLAAGESTFERNHPRCHYQPAARGPQPAVVGAGSRACPKSRF
jgi:hypothetical protein